MSSLLQTQYSMQPFISSPHIPNNFKPTQEALVNDITSQNDQISSKNNFSQLGQEEFCPITTESNLNCKRVLNSQDNSKTERKKTRLENASKHTVEDSTGFQSRDSLAYSMPIMNQNELEFSYNSYASFSGLEENIQNQGQFTDIINLQPMPILTNTTVFGSGLNQELVNLLEMREVYCMSETFRDQNNSLESYLQLQQDKFGGFVNKIQEVFQLSLSMGGEVESEETQKITTKNKAQVKMVSSLEYQKQNLKKKTRTTKSK